MTVAAQNKQMYALMDESLRFAHVFANVSTSWCQHICILGGSAKGAAAEL